MRMAGLRRKAKGKSDACPGRDVRAGEAGFSYVDMMVAVTILLVGIMGMLSAITAGIVMTTTSQQHLAAKQYAQSTIEAIFSARDLQELTFDAIGNVGDTSIPGGIFLSGDQRIYPSPGRDGVVGTADDAAGPDGVAGTADDGAPADGFTRQIEISNVPDPDRPGAAISLRQIKVTVTYIIGGARFSESMTTYAANYRTRD
jgi:type II secretory pathway pseudopilin PulG